MTHSNPASGHDPALLADRGLTSNGPRDLTGLDTLEGRISAWCAWFDLEEPTLKRNRKREVLLNDGLLIWAAASGCSLDWIFTGEVRGMAVAFRKSALERKRFEDVFGQFDETEQRLLVDALKAHQEGGVPFEEALEGWTEAVEAYRAAQ